MPGPIQPELFPQIRESFRLYLRRRGIKDTQARRSILDTVLDFREHFEAEQLLYALKESGRRVGKATVYRTLPLLVDAGILKEVRFGKKQAHYEQVYGQAPHDHMVCRRCGIIYEFDAEEVIALRQRIAAQQHFHADGHRFQLLGLCNHCASTPPSQNP